MHEVHMHEVHMHEVHMHVSCMRKTQEQHLTGHRFLNI